MPSLLRHRILVRLLACLVPLSLGAVALVPGSASAAWPASYTVETWRSVEIALTSTATYADPFADVEVTASFRGPRGQVITRPAFWDGGSTWKVRFAPPAVGAWTMRTSATNTADTGLNGVTASVRAVPYQGNLAIYQHGFLRPSPDGRYLQHADGTPFFYLGDTHWILPHERFDTSNAPGVDSQFKYVVDKRVDQGFTVFQSEPIWQPHGGSHGRPDEEPAADLTNGLSSDDLAGFAAMDKKFGYIADAGLVHANAMVSWVAQPSDNPGVMTPGYMASVARYWDARYGAYPVTGRLVLRGPAGHPRLVDRAGRHSLHDRRQYADYLEHRIHRTGADRRPDGRAVARHRDPVGPGQYADGGHLPAAATGPGHRLDDHRQFRYRVERC